MVVPLELIPQFKKNNQEREKKNSPLLCGLLSCQAGLCAIDSHSVVFSDAKRRRGGGGGWGRVGWDGGGKEEGCGWGVPGWV